MEVNTQANKIFQPSLRLIPYLLAMSVVLLLGVGISFYDVLPYRLDGVLFVIAVSLVIAVVILFFRTTEKVEITPHGIVIHSLVGKQTIPFDSIQMVTMEEESFDADGCTIHFLLIRTVQAKFSIGSWFTHDQLNEAAIYILEQIRIHYPENYARMQDEKKQKEQEAVAEFWRQ